MNKLLIALALALGVAAPAQATGGLLCRTAGQNPTEVSLVISHTAVASVVSARLTASGRSIPVTVAQSWLDQDEFRLDLTDPNAMRHELRLRTKANGPFYDGSLWRGGKRQWGALPGGLGNLPRRSDVKAKARTFRTALNQEDRGDD